jgi:preprotein translocase subunit SecG
MGIFGVILLVLFIIVCILMLFLVIVQDENSEGLGGIFGGSSDTAFGASSGNILTKMTYIVGALFLVLALGLAFINRTPENTSLLTNAQQTSQESTEWWNQPVDPAEAE